MIDIHSHILNNVDDGADSLEDTLDILAKAEKAGFTDVILTPHYIENYYENTRSIIKSKIGELKNILYSEGILVDVHHGNEILLTDNTASLIENCLISTLADSRYTLIELPFTNKLLNFESIILQLKELGCIPVLAHPERYVFIQENPEELIKIIKMGVLVQSNYGSFIGIYGKATKNTAELLLENHLIHFLGTDTHKQGQIFENINKILKKLQKISGNSRYINQITTINPKLVLEDFDIYVDCPDCLNKKILF